jgi:acyl carrier protein
MNSPSHTLVYALLAPLLATEEVSVQDADLLDELGLDALDLVLIAITLEELEPEKGSFPLGALRQARSIGDLVKIVDVWWRADAPSSQGRSLL